MAKSVIRDKRRHLEMMLLCVAALLLAPLLEVRGGQRVGPRGLPEVELPPSCASKSLFDFDCPGCGLTRSFITFSRGEWSESVGYHRVGWILMIAAAIQIPYRLALIYGAEGFIFRKWIGRIFGLSLIAMLLLNWLISLFQRR